MIPKKWQPLLKGKTGKYIQQYQLIYPKKLKTHFRFAPLRSAPYWDSFARRRRIWVNSFRMEIKIASTPQTTIARINPITKPKTNPIPSTWEFRESPITPPPTKKKSAKNPFKNPTILARKVFTIPPFLGLGLRQVLRHITHPCTSKKQGNSQADGGGQFFHTKTLTQIL